MKNFNDQRTVTGGAFESQVYEPPSIITLIAASCVSGSASSFGAVTQLIANMDGSPCAIANVAGVGKVLQQHQLVALATAQSNQSPAAPVFQVDYQPGFVNLIGDTTKQDAASGVGRLAQEHRLVSAAAQQSSSIAVGSIEISYGSVSILAAACVQVAQSSAQAVSQLYVLRAVPGAQANAVPTALVTQDHALAAAPISQAAVSADGAVRHAHLLVGEGSVSVPLSPGVAVEHSHTLLAAKGLQVNATARAAVVQEHSLLGAASAQGNRAEVGAADFTIQTLAGTASSQASATSTGVTFQRQVLAGSPSLTVNSVSPAVVAQNHELTGVDLTERHASKAAPVVQQHGLSAAGVSQQNDIILGMKFEISHRIVSETSLASGTSSIGTIAVSHDLIVPAAAQRNPSLGSGVTCIQELLALDAGQINLTSDADLTGKVSIFMPPQGDRFRFTSSGDRPSENW